MASTKQRKSLKLFERFSIDDIRSTLGLKRLKQHSTLDKWLNTSVTFTPAQQEQIEYHRNNLLEHIERWNEQELQLFFISHILGMVNFEGEEYRAFAQRQIQADIGDITIGGRIDFLVAMGYGEPKQPFFFLHEYKKERGTDSDPLAQVLAAMAAAQVLNRNLPKQPNPLYGCYVLGRNWFFVILDGTTYTVSNAFNAASEDLAQIVAILRETAERIRTFVEG